MRAPKESLCDMCKLVVNFLKPYVDNNSTEVSVCSTQHQLVYIVQLSLAHPYLSVCLSVCLQEEVKDVLKELCDLLPGLMKAEVCAVSKIVSKPYRIAGKFPPGNFFCQMQFEVLWKMPVLF